MSLRLPFVTFIYIFTLFCPAITDPTKTAQYILAFYTKHGPFATPDYYRYNYTIDGYQPTIYQLSPSPKMFASDPYYLK